MSEQNKAVLRHFIEEVINRGNLELLDELLSPDVVMHRAEGEIRGIEAARQHVLRMHNTFPDTHVTIEDMIAEDDKVVMRLTFRATLLGMPSGNAPVGKPVTYMEIFIARLAEGKIVENWATEEELIKDPGD